MRAVLPLLLLSACTFDTSNVGSGAGADEDASPLQADARSFPDAAPPADAVASCTPSETICNGDILETCGADGMGLDPGLATTCDFACVDDARCISASNLSGPLLDLCDGQSQLLAPAAGAKLTIVDNAGNPEIQCVPDCGDGETTTIIAQATVVHANSPDLALFCLSILDLPAGADLAVALNLPWALAMAVEGTATVAGVLDVSGRGGTAAVAGGAGPGGGSGGPLHSDNNQPGEGFCPGLGGVRGGDQGVRIGGGGAGGGFAGTGGNGGRGQSSNNGDTGAGGVGGGPCGNETLIPLFAGSGGGSGGDGSGGEIGWPGGGGAGALQISSKVSIDLSGTITAKGGQGYSEPGAMQSPLGGGSGGGSGGGILLEAPVLTLTGAITVEGGNGADGSAGQGGAGASAAESNGANGADEAGSGESGGGGGGGSGRVRLNATVAPTCSGVSPVAACTSGTVTSP